MIKSQSQLKLSIVLEIIVAYALLIVGGLTYFDSIYVSLLLIFGGFVALDATMVNYRALKYKRQDNE